MSDQCECNCKCKTEVAVKANETFRDGLACLLNSFSKEYRSNTPDFILAEYLENCLKVYDKACEATQDWYEKGMGKGEESRQHGTYTYIKTKTKKFPGGNDAHVSRDLRGNGKKKKNKKKNKKKATTE